MFSLAVSPGHPRRRVRNIVQSGSESRTPKKEGEKHFQSGSESRILKKEGGKLIHKLAQGNLDTEND